jgi:hypothetical protein
MARGARLVVNLSPAIDRLSVAEERIGRTGRRASPPTGTSTPLRKHGKTPNEKHDGE